MDTDRLLGTIALLPSVMGQLFEEENRQKISNIVKHAGDAADISHQAIVAVTDEIISAVDLALEIVADLVAEADGDDSRDLAEEDTLKTKARKILDAKLERQVAINNLIDIAS